MRACLEMLTEGNVELPVAEVAERSGVNRGTVYRWWPTPTELLHDALQFHERHRADAPDTGSWEGDVRALITQLASLAADPIERALMAAMISGRYPTLNATMLGWHRGHEPHWYAMIGRAIERGEVNPDVDMATLIRMMLSPALTASLFDGRALAPGEVDALVTLVCCATARPPGESRHRPTPSTRQPRSARQRKSAPT